MRLTDPAKLDLVRDEILHAATGLFKKYGIDKTTMEDIAEASGKGKSTLYYYFKTKEDVFSSAATLENNKLQQLIENGLRGAKSAGEKITLFFTLQDKYLRTQIKLFPTVFKESKKHVALFLRLQRMDAAWGTQLFTAILHEGINSGEFKRITKEECDTISATAIAALYAIQLNQILEYEILPDTARIVKMVEIFVRGLK